MRARAVALLVALTLCTRAGRALDFTPPPCSMPPQFADLPVADPACRWIRQLWQDGATAGCGGGNFCPQQPVTRAQAAAFLEKAMRGTASWAPWRGHYARTIVVSPVPGDTPASGAALLAAMTAAAGASAGNRHLVKLEPGLYDVSGSLGVNVPPFVDLEGSGVRVTTIRAQSLLDQGLVLLLGESALRSLTVLGETSGGTPSSVVTFGPGLRRLADVRVASLNGIALECMSGGELRVERALLETNGSSALRLDDCQATVEDSDLAVLNFGFVVKAIYLLGGDTLHLHRSTVFAGSYNGRNVGIEAWDATLDIQDTYIRADGGPHSTSTVEVVSLKRSNTTIVASDLEATGSTATRWALYHDSHTGAYVTRVRESRLAGGKLRATANDMIQVAGSQFDQATPDPNGGFVTCFKSYDENFINATVLFGCP